VAALGRAGQLVGDQIIHPLQLLGSTAAQGVGVGFVFDQSTQHRQRGLQAVRQIAQGVAIALQVLALALDELVETLGQAQQLARIAAAQLRGIARSHLGQILGHPAQRRQAPAQTHSQHHQQ